MHIFLSALEGAFFLRREGGRPVAEALVERGTHLKFNLVSFFALDKDARRMKNAYFIRDNSEEAMVDSGAHSFQKGKVVNCDEYTERYAAFIRSFDAPNVVGFFEMDVDKIIGLEKVRQLRAVLERVSDKIIPVWHKGRGIDDFKRMCDEHRGRVIAITGFANEDIKDEQYLMFLKYAWKRDCRVHCLGMTRTKVLSKVPFDYTDSSSWLQRTLYGQFSRTQKVRLKKEFMSAHRGEVFVQSYLEDMKIVKHYQEFWSAYENRQGVKANEKNG